MRNVGCANGGLDEMMSDISSKHLEGLELSNCPGEGGLSRALVIITRLEWGTD